MLAKTVKVHDDTHRVLKQLKVRRRSGSIDEVVREMIRTSTGVAVERTKPEDRAAQLSAYSDD